MTVFRAALVGAGAMGGIIAREIAPTLRGSLEIAAVVDRDPRRARALAEPLGAGAYASLADAVADQAALGTPLDGADLRLPHDAHRSALEEALDLRLHVLVEKPLALSAADLAAVVAADRRAHDAGLIVAVAENYPHLRAVRAAASAVADGRIGELLAVRTTRAYPLDGDWAASGWRQDGGAASGILWDQGTHHTSLIRAVAGEVARVGATASSALRSPGTETVALQLDLVSGVAAQSLYCWGAPAVDVEVEAVLLGTRGRLEIGVSYDGAAGAAVLVGPDGTRTAISEAEDYYESHGWILRDWALAARERRSPRVAVADAVEDARVVLAAIASLAAGGGPIDVGTIGIGGGA